MLLVGNKPQLKKYNFPYLLTVEFSDDVTSTDATCADNET